MLMTVEQARGIRTSIDDRLERFLALGVKYCFLLQFGHVDL